SRQHLYRSRRLPRVQVDNGSAGRGCEGSLRRPEAGFSRPLPPAAGDGCEAIGDTVSSRDLQPASLGPVLAVQWVIPFLYQSGLPRWCSPNFASVETNLMKMA